MVMSFISEVAASGVSRLRVKKSLLLISNVVVMMVLG